MRIHFPSYLLGCAGALLFCLAVIFAEKLFMK